MIKMSDSRRVAETVRLSQVNNGAGREREGEIRHESTTEAHGGLHLKADSERWRVARRCGAIFTSIITALWRRLMFYDSCAVPQTALGGCGSR